MSEQQRLTKIDLVREKEDYDIHDICYFARDILSKDPEVSDIYGQKPAQRIEWHTSDGPIELYGTDLNQQRILFRLTVDNPDRINDKIVYLFSEGDQNEHYISATSLDSDSHIDTTPAENSEMVMNYLRTHPTVDEPLMNSIGRSRIRYMKEALKLVISEDKQLPPAATDTK